MPFEALVLGRTRSTYAWAFASCIRRSSSVFSRSLLAAAATSLATM
jgi:hypothetical protein